MINTLMTLAVGALLLAPADEPQRTNDTRTDEKRPAAGSAAQTDGRDAGATAMTPELVLSKIHATNQMEVQFGRLAKSKGTSKEVRDYGDRLVRDHQDAEKKVKAIASQKNITLTEPKPVDAKDAAKVAEQKQALSRLQRLQGESFDREFLKTMAEGHEHTIETLQKAKASVQDPAVQGLVDELMPVLKKHHEMAEDAEPGRDSEKRPSSTMDQP